MYTDVRCKESTLSNKFVKSALTHPLSTKAIDPLRALPLSTEWQASIGSAATRFTVPNSNSWKETEKDENQWTSPKCPSTSSYYEAQECSLNL